MEENIYLIYVLLIYFVSIYVYGVISYLNLKNTCSNLRNTGAPNQICIPPESRTARCWNTGSQLSCSHCVFGYKELSSKTGHVCKSNSDTVQNIPDCRYSNEETFPKITSNDDSVKIKYLTDDGTYVDVDDVLDDGSKNEKPLETLVKNCYYDIQITSTEEVKTECQNVTPGGDGICRKDYDTHVTTQKIRYRPDKNSDPLLKFTKETQ